MTAPKEQIFVLRDYSLSAVQPDYPVDCDVVSIGTRDFTDVKGVSVPPPPEQKTALYAIEFWIVR